MPEAAALQDLVKATFELVTGMSSSVNTVVVKLENLTKDGQVRGERITKLETDLINVRLELATTKGELKALQDETKAMATRFLVRAGGAALGSGGLVAIAAKLLGG